jgi:hypothetical protein
MSDHLALAMNLEVYAASQYTNYPFNSLCEFNGVLLGAGESGIFELEKGDRDELAPINALVEFPKTDFGIPLVKHARRIVINGRSYGNLLLTLSADDGLEFTKHINVRSIGKHSTMFEYLRSDCRGVYLLFRLENIDGAYFSIDQIDLDLITASLRETPA